VNLSGGMYAEIVVRPPRVAAYLANCSVKKEGGNSFGK
jgi:hypothetical protein